MSESTVFALGVGGTLAVSLIVMAYLHGPLKSVLTDLCGTVERASFWCAFSNLTLFLLPLLFMLDYSPGENAGPVGFWVLAAVLKRGVLGLAVTVVTLGIVMGCFIRRGEIRVAARNQ